MGSGLGLMVRVRIISEWLEFRIKLGGVRKEDVLRWVEQVPGEWEVHYAGHFGS